MFFMSTRDFLTHSSQKKTTSSGAKTLNSQPIGWSADLFEIVFNINLSKHIKADSMPISFRYKRRGTAMTQQTVCRSVNWGAPGSSGFRYGCKGELQHGRSKLGCKEGSTKDESSKETLLDFKKSKVISCHAINRIHLVTQVRTLLEWRRGEGL